VLPAAQSPDSKPIKNNHTTSSFPRENVFMIQTPQIFSARILKKAYEQAFDPNFTDDASVVEKAGYPVHLIEGDIQNIKITYPSDMDLANYWLN
jgi:2-C-methyl-D-erythritol 4-phosphate cytidylyltransferase